MRAEVIIEKIIKVLWGQTSLRFEERDLGSHLTSLWMLFQPRIWIRGLARALVRTSVPTEKCQRRRDRQSAS